MNIGGLRHRYMDISYQSDYSNLESSFSRYSVLAFRSIYVTCTANHHLIDLDCISKQDQGWGQFKVRAAHIWSTQWTKNKQDSSTERRTRKWV